VPDCSVVLSALANVSSSNPGKIEKTFQVGAPPSADDELARGHRNPNGFAGIHPKYYGDRLNPLSRR